MEPSILSLEQSDYLEEMMNIGAGNAATALEQLLRSKFEMRLPAVRILPPHQAAPVIGDPAKAITGVKMNMIGDILGEIYFIVPREMNAILADLAQTGADLAGNKITESDVAVITEIGNILAGVYLTAIHDFSSLNIYHTVPVMTTDMAQAVLDETIAMISAQSGLLIIIVNSFMSLARGKTIESYLIMVPVFDSLKILTDSIREAKRRTRG